MIWPFNRKDTTETGAEYYIRDAAMADAKAIITFKHRIWRQMFAKLKDEAFFATAEATIDEQVEFWQSRINRGATVWLAEDLRGRIVGTVHATEKLSDHTAQFLSVYGVEHLDEIRFFYLADETANTNVGQQLLHQAVGDRPALFWAAGEEPLVEEALRHAGFEPTGQPHQPTTEPWQGVPRQAMVRK